MGFSRLGLAIGGAIGYTGGGWLYDYGHAYHVPEFPWILLGTIGLITLVLLFQWQRNQNTQPVHRTDKQAG